MPGTARAAAQVILRWHLQLGDVAIPKSSRAERMRENLDVLGFVLDDARTARLDPLDRGAEGRVGPHPDPYEG